MYLKSISIKNFRKFGGNNNEVQFAEAGDYLQDSVASNSDGDEKQININIAPKTTLIVGKNNSGKTTIIDALDILLNKGEKFCSTDFNLAYLNSILDDCKKNQDKIIENIPQIEFNIKIGLNNENSSDIISELYQVLAIGDVESKECNIILKYQVDEDSIYIEKVKELLVNYGSSLLLFDKFKQLIDDTNFKLQYYDNKNTIIKNFKLSNLIGLTYIMANNIRTNKCLTNAFSKIVEYKYNNSKSQNKIPKLDSDIDNVNKILSEYMKDSHTNNLNKTIKKIMDSQKCQILLKSDLTVKNMLTNVIKYYFIEKENEVPEDQFGLGYTNLIMIVAEILQYMEKYPSTAYNSQINLIAIEEPETFMHPQMQELFIKNINEMICDLLNNNHKNINSQIIITTHSPHILNSKIHTGGTFNNINYIREESGYARITALDDDAIADFTVKEKNKLKTILDKGKIKNAKLKEKYYQFEFIKKHIKFKVSEVFFADAVVFVEGVCEYNLVQYYIDQNEKLNKKFISIVLIDGAHAKMYQKLINMLNIPTLIITDIDIKRQAKEKGEKYTDENGKVCIEYKQIYSLKDRTSTNETLNEYMRLEKINELVKYNYYEKDELKVVFQKDSISKVFSTSFEEAFILTNKTNKVLKKILSKLKPDIYSEIEVAGGILKNSFKWQCKLDDDKARFANEVLFKEMNEIKDKSIFKLPQYIIDGLEFLEKKLGE